MMAQNTELYNRDSDPGERQGGIIVPGESAAVVTAKGTTQPCVATESQPGPSGTALSQASDALPTGASAFSSSATVEAPRPSTSRDTSVGSIPLATRVAWLRDAGLIDAALDTKLPSGASSLDEPPLGSAQIEPPSSARDAMLNIEHHEGWECALTVATHTTGSGVGARTASPARSASTAMSVEPPPQPIVELSSAESDVSVVLTSTTATKRKKNADQFRKQTASQSCPKQDRGGDLAKRRRKQRDAATSDDEPSELPLPVPLHAAPYTAAKPSRYHLRKERAIANDMADYAGRSLQAVGAEMLAWVAECEDMRKACTNLPGEGIQGGISGRISGRLRDRLLRLKIGLQAVCTSNPEDAVSADAAYTRMQAKQDAVRLQALESRLQTFSAEAARVPHLEADNRFLREELHRRSAELRRQRRVPQTPACTQTSPLPPSVPSRRPSPSPEPQLPGSWTPPPSRAARPSPAAPETRRVVVSPPREAPSSSLCVDELAAPPSPATIQRAADLIPAEGLPAKIAAANKLIRDMVAVRDGLEHELRRQRRPQREPSPIPSGSAAWPALPSRVSHQHDRDDPRSAQPVPLSALCPEVHLREEPPSSAGAWTNVPTRSQRRRLQRVRATASAQAPPLRSRPPVPPPQQMRPRGPPAAPLRAQRARARPRRRPHRTAAVSITCVGDETSYAGVLREARAKISLSAHGVQQTRLRRARTGGYLLEIPEKEGDAKADSVAAGLRQAFAGRADIIIGRPAQVAELRLLGLDDSVLPEEVASFVAQHGGCREADVTAGPIRASPRGRGLGTVWARCPLKTRLDIM